MNEANQPTYTLTWLAELLEASIIGDPEATVTGVASIQEAEAGDIVFAETSAYVQAGLRSRAAALIAGRGTDSAGANKPLLLVDNPRAAFVRVLEAFAPVETFLPGIDASAIIRDNVVIGAGVHIGPHVSVGSDVVLGAGVVLMAGVRVGDGCTIGEGTRLYPNVVCYPRVQIGRGCLIHAGSVVGADGFGYVPVGQILQKVPHLGTVRIGDGVEIGANCCVDRAKTGATVIDSGTKLDNLIHVAHNVRIGRSSLLVAQTGIAGSTTIGDGVILAGQSGIADHLKIGDGARVGAQGGVIGDVAPGVSVSGYPARPHAEKMREYAALAALPGYIKRIRALEKRLAALESKIELA